jgi:hypothetical protein
VDFVVPVVFPDYLIVINDKPVQIDLRDLLPGRDLFPHFVRIPVTRLPELGHAGVLFINGRTGTTKYYEYGRYDRAARGLVMRRPIPDVKILAGQPTLASLRVTLTSISHQAGQNGRISGAFISLPDGKYAKMLAYAQKRLKANTDPNRPEYHLLSNSCIHFMKEVVEAADVQAPTVIDPRPDGYVERLRAAFPPLDFKPKTQALVVPILVETSAAKAPTSHKTIDP